MVVAVAKALEEGARSIICASTGQHVGVRGRATARRPGSRSSSCCRRARSRSGKLLQALVAGARVVAVDGNFDDALRVVRDARRAGRPPRDARQLGQPAPDRRPEDRGVRDLRRPRPGARRPRDPGRQRRQHHRLLGRVHRLRDGRHRRDAAADARASRPPAPRRSSAVTPIEQPETIATAIRIGNPASWAKAPRGPRRVAAGHRGRHRRRDPRRLPRPRAARGRVLRALVGGVASPACASWPRPGGSTGDALVVVRADRQRPEGSRRRRRGAVAAGRIVEVAPTVGDASRRALGW